jgi:hypothetical protein
VRASGLSVSFAIAVLGGCAAHVVTTPAPAPSRGAQIRYATRPDTSRLFNARLISLDGDSLVSERFVDGTPTGKWLPEAVATDSLALVQVRIGSRGNAGRGALIGGLAGVVLGGVCAAQTEEGWLEPTRAQCVFGLTLMGAGSGLLLGALIRSDVWAPYTPPPAHHEPPAAPVAVSVGPEGVGVRIPIRVPGP